MREDAPLLKVVFSSFLWPFPLFLSLSLSGYICLEKEGKSVLIRVSQSAFPLNGHHLFWRLLSLFFSSSVEKFSFSSLSSVVGQEVRRIRRKREGGSPFVPSPLLLTKRENSTLDPWERDSQWQLPKRSEEQASLSSVMWCLCESEGHLSLLWTRFAITSFWLPVAFLEDFTVKAWCSSLSHISISAESHWTLYSLSSTLFSRLLLPTHPQCRNRSRECECPASGANKKSRKGKEVRGTWRGNSCTFAHDFMFLEWEWGIKKERAERRT